MVGDETPAPYPDDPEAPYFEHLYALVKEFKPETNRDETLAILREVDPTNELRIEQPLTDDTED